MLPTDGTDSVDATAAAARNVAKAAVGGCRPTPLPPAVATVGYWASEKKRRNFRFADFVRTCRTAGIEMVELNVDAPIEQQLHVDAVLHKLSDAVEPNSAHRWRNLQEYIESKPNVKVLDPIDSVRLLGDRSVQYQFLDSLQRTCGMGTPPWAKVDGSEAASAGASASLLAMLDVRYPLVCKPLAAHGKDAHEMCLVFSPHGLSQLGRTGAFVVQQYVPHDGVLYKLFALGDELHVVRRPSLRNFDTADRDNIHFHSAAVSKGGTSELNSADAGLSDGPAWCGSDELLSRFGRVVAAVRRRTGLSLFGVDVIVDCRDRRTAYMIDLNIFPSYDGVPDVHEGVLRLLRSVLAGDRGTENGTANGADGLTEVVHAPPQHTALVRSQSRQRDRPVGSAAGAATRLALDDSGVGTSTTASESDSAGRTMRAAGVHHQQQRSRSRYLVRGNSRPCAACASKPSGSGGGASCACYSSGPGDTVTASGAPPLLRQASVRSADRLAPMADWAKIKQFYGIPKPVKLRNQSSSETQQSSAGSAQ